MRYERRFFPVTDMFTRTGGLPSNSEDKIAAVILTGGETPPPPQHGDRTKRKMRMKTEHCQ